MADFTKLNATLATLNSNVAILVAQQGQGAADQASIDAAEASANATNDVVVAAITPPTA